MTQLELNPYNVKLVRDIEFERQLTMRKDYHRQIYYKNLEHPDVVDLRKQIEDSCELLRAYDVMWNFTMIKYKR